ncbi:MAG: hypothetical protein J6Y28_02190 [Acholeplasmatales bacterium]|nr:hypothetical protein [Acholeplasmatales bacterium]
MKFKKLTILALSALSMFALASCKKEEKNEKTTSVITTKSGQVDQKYKIYLLAKDSGFNGTYEEWLESVKGEKGENGDSITVMVIDGKLKWKYSLEDDSKYRLLLDLATLKGENGTSSVTTIGTNGNWFINGEDTQIRAYANDGRGIESISKGESVGLTDNYIIKFTDGSEVNFTVTNGKDGGAGTEGRGIVSIDKGESTGLIDSYIINFTDNTDTTFYVVNGAPGAQGQKGVGISKVEKTNTEGLVDTYTITYTDGSYSTFTITNGEDGTEGEKGVGILKVEKTGTDDLVDTYTITFTNGDTTSFTVTNGKDGQDAEVSEEIVQYSDNGFAKTIYTYDGNSVTAESYKYLGLAGWVKTTKRIQTNESYAEVDIQTIEEFDWNEDDSKWFGNKKTISYYFDSKLSQIVTYSWSISDDDWEKNFYHVVTYENDKVYSECDYKYSSEKEFFEKYGVEIYSRPEYNSSTIIDYIWETETSGITAMDMEIYGGFIVNDVKRQDIYAKYHWSYDYNKYVIYDFYKTDFDEYGAVTNTMSITEDFPYFEDGSILSSRVECTIGKANHTYVYVYNDCAKAMVPKDLFISEYDSVAHQLAYGETYSRWNIETMTWDYTRIEKSTMNDFGYPEKTYIEYYDKGVKTINIVYNIQYTYIENASFDHYRELSSYQDVLYDGVWSYYYIEYTYDEIGNTVGSVEQKLIDGEWVNFYKYETVKEDNTYRWIEYHWDSELNDWVEGSPWQN